MEDWGWIEWVRVVLVCGFLTALGSRLYGRPFALAGLFAVYFVMLLVYVHIDAALQMAHHHQ